MLDEPHGEKQPKISQIADVASPITPITNTSTPPRSMDSDDEYMSGTSSQEEGFDGTQESDDGSLGDGV